jgi:hypothetical protein
VVYDYIKSNVPVRFAKENEVIPNFEVKPVKSILGSDAFNDRIEVRAKLGNLEISSLERQIAFKRYFLKSDKDIEDARHIEEVFKDKLNKPLIEKYKRMIKENEAKNIKKQ